ncbi:MAG: PAS domain-containing protein, partial [Gemmataceae bacterium]|nr:PAS domain-containing protein [Gemmataceae bacterium]
MPTPVPRPLARATSLRVAALYLGSGLAWIWATDFALRWAGLQGETGFLASAGKGSLFVLLTAPLVCGLVRRDLRAVERARELLQAVADVTPDAVYVKDRDGRYLLFNRAAARFVGKPAEEVLGRDDTALFPPDEAGRLMARDRQVMAGGVADTTEERLTAAGVTRVY